RQRLQTNNANLRRCAPTARPDERGIGGRMLVGWVAGWRGMRTACESKGFLGGDRVHEEVIEQDHESGYETVERYSTPVEFYCPTCDLHLEGAEAMKAAGFDEEYVEQDEREIEYEPDYGND
ncbi:MULTISPECIES: hypothetical protein, partial [unclassified Pseudomonas]|uniref:hypothetical protein n=1 Tax=unclassified Pseudomonas TaxID=196821 RepID=UPI001D02126B